MGSVMLCDGTIVCGTIWPESRVMEYCERIAGSQLRGRMIWALEVADRKVGEE
jgi:hypothetical protein